MSTELNDFANLEEIATYLRKKLTKKKHILLFAYNSTGKTRLSMNFKKIRTNADERDTLYFNAFTEDLFTWHNDFEFDENRELRFNTESRFFKALETLEMDNRIRPLLRRYVDFDFTIEDNAKVRFRRDVLVNGKLEELDNIKVSRGEENIFIWCFFLAIAQIAIDQEEGSSYQWVKYIYIDDPISSLDDNNVIAVASHLAHLLEKNQTEIKVVISSHHALFFNVMWNSLDKIKKSKPVHSYFLSNDKDAGTYSLCDTGDTPSFHHVALLKQLYEATESGKLFTYHFSMLRSILEKSASFHGFNNFSACIKKDADDPDGIVYARMINVLSHGNYSLYEPVEMLEENKKYWLFDISCGIKKNIPLNFCRKIHNLKNQETLFERNASGWLCHSSVV